MKGRVLDGVALVMHDNDTVVTALDDLDGGTAIATTVDTQERDDTTSKPHSDSNTAATTPVDTPTVAGDDQIVLVDEIPFGHKFAIEPITEGEHIVKYGETIGRATADITSGEWVHTHNCESTRGRGDLMTDADGTRSGEGDRA